MAGKNEKKLLRGSVTFNGKRYYVSGYTKKEVQEKRIQKRLELEAGVIDPARITVREWSEEWLKRYKQGKVNPRWYRDVEQNLRKWVLPVIGPYQLSKVKQYHIQEMLGQLEGKSQSLIKKTHDNVNSMFQKAWLNGLINRNPVVDIELPTPAKKKVRRSITEKERAIFIKTATEMKGGIFFLIMLYAGLRPQEVAALRWQHIDFEKDLIYVRQMIKSDGTIEDSGKTINATRDVFISAELKKSLQKQYKEVPHDKGAFVVPKRNSNNHQTKNSIRKLWLDIRLEMHKEAGGKTTKTIKEYVNGKTGEKYNRSEEIIEDDYIAKDFVPYCLRHTYCTDLRAAGVPVEVAKDLMGHSSISITADIYSHAEEISIASAKEKMDRLNDERSVRK